MRALARRLFVDNAALKVVSIILAVTLFILVHGERDTIVTANIKVVYTMPQDRVLTSEPVEEVRVRIRGPWTRVKRFDERDVDPIYVDLNDVGDGELSFQEDMVRLPPGLKISSINPPVIRLAFEKLTTKQVPVSVTLEGEPARGHKVEGTTARPDRVTIRGAKSAVDRTQSVETRRLSISGKTSEMRERVSFAPLEETLSVIDAVNVEVEVRIVEEQAEQILENVRVTPAVASGAAVEDGPDVTPATVRVILRGARNVLEELDQTAIKGRVRLEPEDLLIGRARKASVVLEGVPPGVTVEVTPAEVTVSGGK